MFWPDFPRPVTKKSGLDSLVALPLQEHRQVNSWSPVMKQSALKSAAFATCALGLFATALPASAGVITYDFTLDQCSGSGCGLRITVRSP